MRRYRWQIILGFSLIGASALLYLSHYVFFRDAHHIFIYMLGDVAFVPIEVLLVTLIIHQILSIRERRSMLEKMNMVIGTFFSEVGTNLLTRLSAFTPGLDQIRQCLLVDGDWTDKEFSRIGGRIKMHEYVIDIKKSDLNGLRTFLIDERTFLLRLLENPNLLEHDSFTDLLWAVFHLAEELAHRGDVENLPESDYAHLSGDIKRAYHLLISEWLDYMRYLKNNYPYLFSLAMRLNPFDMKASPVIT